MHNKKIHILAFILLIVGGLNWLLHAFGYNVVNMVLGGMPAIEQAVYILVGLAAIYELITHKGHCVHCGGSSAAPAAGMGGRGDVTHG